MDNPQGGRRPLAVEQAGADLLTVLGHEPAGTLVEHDQARGQRPGNADVRAIDAVGGTRVQEIAVDQRRAVGRILHPDVHFVDQVAGPDDIAVGGQRGDARTPDAGNELPLVLERPFVALGQAVDPQAGDVAAIGRDVDPVAVDRGRGANAERHVVKIELGQFRLEARNGKLPEQFPSGLVEAHQTVRHASSGRAGSCNASSLVPM